MILYTVTLNQQESKSRSIDKGTTEILLFEHVIILVMAKSETMAKEHTAGLHSQKSSPITRIGTFYFRYTTRNWCGHLLFLNMIATYYPHVIERIVSEVVKDEDTTFTNKETCWPYWHQYYCLLL